MGGPATPHPGLSLKVSGDRSLSFLKSRGGKGHPRGYTHSLTVQGAEILGTRAKKEGSRKGCITVSLREVTGDGGAREM